MSLIRFGALKADSVVRLTVRKAELLHDPREVHYHSGEADMNRKYLNLRWWSEALIPRARVIHAQIGFKPEVIDKRIEDVSCKFFISSPTACVWYGDRRSESSIEMRFVRDHILQPGHRVIEVGAHHGLGTIALSRWVGEEGIVYACEPMPENVTVLQRNLELNSIDNVRVVPQALGPRAGRISFREDTNGSIMGHHSGRGIDLDMMTIDQLCESEGFLPDLIKIDVEGYEADVLEGASRTLRHRPALQIEVHPHQIGNFDKTVEQLWDLIDTPHYELWHQPHDMAQVRRIAGPIKIADRSHVYCVPSGRS
jgi:FkbM family methyltransferase